VAQYGALDTNVFYCKMSLYQQIRMVIKKIHVTVRFVIILNCWHWQ